GRPNACPPRFVESTTGRPPPVGRPGAIWERSRCQAARSRADPRGRIPMAICVTGGSSGFGRAIAERFARDGNDVFINYHANDEAAAEAEAAVAAAGGTPHLVKADVGT